MMQPSIIFMQCSCLGMQPCLGLLPLVEPLKQFFMGYCKFGLEDIIFLGESKNLVLLTLQPNWRVRCHWYTYQWYLTMQGGHTGFWAPCSHMSHEVFCMPKYSRVKYQPVYQKSERNLVMQRDNDHNAQHRRIK